MAENELTRYEARPAPKQNGSPALFGVYDTVAARFVEFELFATASEARQQATAYNRAWERQR